MCLQSNIGKQANMPRPALTRHRSSFKRDGTGQSILVIWVEYVNPPYFCTGWPAKKNLNELIHLIFFEIIFFLLKYNKITFI